MVAKPPAKWDLEVDLVALGSSSGGLTAALVGHDLGLKVVVLEKDDLIGGGTATSGGVIWAAMTRPQREDGIQDSREEALTFIRSIGFGRHDEVKAAAYVDEAPKALDYLEKRSYMTLARMHAGDDYYRHYPGSKPGRSVSPHPDSVPAFLWEREKTDPLVKKVRHSSLSVTVQPPNNPWKFVPLLGGGRSIIGTLAAGCTDRQIPVLTKVRARELVVEDSRVTGIRAERDGRPYFVKARLGVLIATGGFEHNQEMNKRYLPVPGPIIAQTPPSNEGDGHLMGMDVGAATALMDTSIYIATAVPFEAGSVQRASASAFGAPGCIVVNRFAKRCANESFYPGLARAVFAQYPGRESNFINMPMYAIIDATAAGKTPAPTLKKADTLAALAKELGIDGPTLEATVAHFNEFARQGKDPDFHRGEFPTPPEAQKDLLGPVEKTPFYAAKLALATVGHKGGLVTNQYAQVLNVRNEVIPGLYATSNAAAHTAVGAGYSSGMANCQSLTFGWVAARHMATAR